MSSLDRIVLVRHGETVGESSIRFHGSGDVALSELGRAQMRESARRVHAEGCGVIVASPLQRAWQAAAIVAPGRSIVIESDFREVHFGRWEGLTREEIQAADPDLYEAWQADPPNYDFPEGEPRAEFRERLGRGIDRLLETPYSSAMVVAHKGIVRGTVLKLVGTELSSDDASLGCVVHITRQANGSWKLGRRSSNPAAIGDAPRG